MLVKLTNQVVDISLDNIKEIQKRSTWWDVGWTDDYILIEYKDKSSLKIKCNSREEVEKDYNTITDLLGTESKNNLEEKSKIDEVFNEVERQKIWNEIVANSSRYKELQQSMEFGYAQGIVAMLSILKENRDLSAKRIRELYLNSMKDTEIDKMVRRLISNK